MQFDWKLGILIFNVLVVGGNIIAYLSLRLNDIRHISEDIGEIKKKEEKIFKRLGRVEKAITIRDAVCAERHPKK